MKLIKLLFDVLVPRFVTDEVAIRLISESQAEVVCLKEQLTDMDDYDEIAYCRCFNLFGVALYPKIIRKSEEENG
ncbi:hypothetical protein [Salinivibrio phage CW02]|uniref:Uncharacterized protein n=1 Tax=Salinivibrio phage CW02 TaxID=1161935 RepID=H9D1F1_9CAUD|nr:hypothetical protein F490_gp44 [Salinivibrio phage CW02]AFE86193.1 hypothetical protein [Salinivibrio phage CW02]